MSAQGLWNVVIKTPVGDKKVTLDFTVDGAALKGTSTDENGTSDIAAGTVEGNTLAWNAKVKKPFPMTMQFSAVIDGDSIGGEAKSAFGSAKFSGNRA